MSGRQRLQLSTEFLGTLLRFGFAVYWQEELIPHDGIYDEDAVSRAGENMYRLNGIIDDLAGWTYMYDEFQHGIHTYPSVEECRYQQPRSIWHEQSALALTDLSELSKTIDAALQSEPDGWTINRGCSGV